jgi:hypothetical protein
VYYFVAAYVAVLYLRYYIMSFFLDGQVFNASKKGKGRRGREWRWGGWGDIKRKETKYPEEA